MPGTIRSSVVAAAVTDVGKVRKHNEDSHLVDEAAGLFVVCDGMGGHRAGEVASATAVQAARANWSTAAVKAAIDAYAGRGDPAARRALIHALREGVMKAHLHIVDESLRDEDKRGMGTTFTGFVLAGGDAVFCHAGDSRAYLVRDEIAMQLSEDHTLLARLKAAGIETVLENGEESRWKGVLTNALGIGDGTKVATFVVPLCDGDRLLLCSDGVSEYVGEAEVGRVLLSAPSPSLAARRLVDLALERGGGDNATALVVKVVEAGLTRVPAEQRLRDERVIASCPLLAELTPQERLRALRITTPREIEPEQPVPAVMLGDRVAHLLLEGEVTLGGMALPPGSLLYADALIQGSPTPERGDIATAGSEVRMLTIRRDDFFELGEEEPDLGVKLYAVLARLVAR
jgi:PPM family protein phosphatase